MKQSIVRDLTTEEIRDRIKEEQSNYARLQMIHAVSPHDSPIKMRTARRFIARLKTELKKRTTTAAVTA
ncbi:MAG: 50S ribosomal protein L29 [Bacteroidia bacterium]